MYSINKKMVNINKQSGVALVISLIILLALTIIGLSAANRSNLQERMAANLHIKNMAFNASESAISGLVAASYDFPNTNVNHLLFNTRNTGVFTNRCYDSVGASHACGSTFLDSDHGGAIKSEVQLRIVSRCDLQACSGNSIGGDSSIGCISYKIDGKGTVAGKIVTSTLWAWEQAPCI